MDIGRIFFPTKWSGATFLFVVGEQLIGHQEHISSLVEISPHNMFATASFDTLVLLWDVQTMQQCAKIHAARMGLRALDYSTFKI